MELTRFEPPSEGDTLAQDESRCTELAKQAMGDKQSLLLGIGLHSNDRPGLSQGDVCPTTRSAVLPARTISASPSC
ncbi:hypothetical protein PSEUDO8O_70075 [Pseudomonas sp. 8O]|nr:hypothetical protein PSEUDO8O_70075 [Pseudomonas sp. 8O]